MKKRSKGFLSAALLFLFVLLICLPPMDTDAAWRQKNNQWYYYTKSSTLLKSRWVGERYVNEEGRWIKSFKKTHKGLRYKLSSGDYLRSGWKTIDGGSYYFNRKGYAVTCSWVGRRYVQANGKYVQGLVQTNEGWRLLKKHGEYAKDSWKTINGRRCYFDEDGYLVKNKSATIQGIKYSFGGKGYMKAGWRILPGGRKYQEQNGHYVKSAWRKIGSNWYYFKGSGYMAKKKWIGDYYVGGNGAIAAGTFVGNQFVDASGKKVTTDSLSLSSPSAVLADYKTGKVIYQKNGGQNRRNASTTKIMTAILALENAGLEDRVGVSAYAASQEESKLYIHPGEVYRMKDLLYALLLPSCNDVAVAIAEHIGGSQQNFANMMNQKARELGCTNTTFVTANGLEEGNHGSSAADLAKMLRYALKKSTFRKIIQTPSYSFSCLSSGRSFTVENIDELLGQMEGFIGGKTGWTTAAGHCFAGALKKNGRTYIAVVLGGITSDSRWQDIRTLFEYGAANYHQ